MRTSYLLAVLSLIPTASYAQGQEPMVTDRPDVTESAIVVTPGRFQLESGIEYEKGGGEESTTFPNSLLRYGFSDKIEGRLELTSWTSLNGHEGSDFNDPSIGVKIQLGQRESETPTALILEASVPVGDSGVSSGRSDYAAVLCHSRPLSANFAVAANLGLNYIYANNERSWLYAPTLSVSTALSERMGCFVEWYALIPENESWQPVIDGGLTYAASSDSQWDLAAGAGLNRHAPDFVFRVGYSFRF